MDALVRQGFRSLLLTRDEAVKERSRAVTGETCGWKDSLKEPVANENAEQENNSHLFLTSFVTTNQGGQSCDVSGQW